MAALPDVYLTEPDSKAAFIAELSRLRNELRDLNARLDGIEAEIRQVLNDILRDRLDGYR